MVSSSQRQQHHSAPTGPLTRSAMAAKPTAGAAPAVAAARHPGSETPPTAPLSSSGPQRPPTPADLPPGEPPRRPITRKRAASINTEEANRPKIENLSLSTPSTAGSRPFDAGRDLICLCTPAPKVPRPRNGTFCSLRKLSLLPEKAAFTSTHLSLPLCLVTYNICSFLRRLKWRGGTQGRKRGRLSKAPANTIT